MLLKAICPWPCGKKTNSTDENKNKGMLLLNSIFSCDILIVEEEFRNPCDVRRRLMIVEPTPIERESGFMLA